MTPAKTLSDFSPFSLGYSSIWSLFYENGPLQPIPNPEGFLNLTTRERSWLDVGNLLYIDQPAGTGFSYTTDEADYVKNEEEMADQLYEAIQIFLRKDIIPSSVRVNKKWYFAGESYAGKYVPAIAKRVLEKNDLGKKDRNEFINLKGCLIGNGLMQAAVQRPHIIKAASAMAYIHPEDKPNLLALSQRCEEAISTQNSRATEFCNYIRDYVIEISGKVDIYDGRGFDYGAVDPLELYLNTGNGEIELLLNSLHIADTPREPVYEIESQAVAKRMDADIVNSSLIYFPYLLQRVPVLIYNGNWDLLDGPVGVDKWLENLPPPYGTEFNQAPRYLWKTDDGTRSQIGGHVKHWKNLTYLVVTGASHSTPMDQRLKTINMVRTFIKGDKWVTDDTPNITVVKCEKYLNNCHGNGVCQVNGTCKCRDGYGRADCSVKAAEIRPGAKVKLNISSNSWSYFKLVDFSEGQKLVLKNPSLVGELRYYLWAGHFGGKDAYTSKGCVSRSETLSILVDPDEFLGKTIYLGFENANHLATLVNVTVRVEPWEGNRKAGFLSGVVALVLLGVALALLVVSCIAYARVKIQKPAVQPPYSDIN